jgi:hypothetical protein
VTFEKSALTAKGMRLVTEEGRLALARITLVDGRPSEVIGTPGLTASGSAATRGVIYRGGLNAGQDLSLRESSLPQTPSVLTSSAPHTPSSSLTSSLSPIRLLVDDYILPLEPVVDYVTRFSGIISEVKYTFV